MLAYAKHRQTSLSPSLDLTATNSTTNPRHALVYFPGPAPLAYHVLVGETELLANVTHRFITRNCRRYRNKKKREQNFRIQHGDGDALHRGSLVK